MEARTSHLPPNLPDLSRVGFVCLLWPGMTGSWGASVYSADGTLLRHLRACGTPDDADQAARDYIAEVNDRLEVAVITLHSQAAIPPVLAEVVELLHAPPSPMLRGALH